MPELLITVRLKFSSEKKFKKKNSGSVPVTGLSAHLVCGGLVMVINEVKQSIALGGALVHG